MKSDYHYKIKLDVRILAILIAIILAYQLGIRLNKDNTRAERVRKVRSRASAMVQDAKNRKNELKRLKIESKPKYYFELVRNYINN